MAEDTDLTETMQQLERFIDQHYKSELLENTRVGVNCLLIDFSKLAIFSPDLAERLLIEPVDTLRLAELACGLFDLPETFDADNFRVHTHNLPQSQSIRIGAIRGRHLGQLISVDGLVQQKTDVRPHMTSVKFECPSCGTVMTVMQNEPTMKKPSKCLPEGTMVYTPSGLLPIEKCREVVCVDWSGRLTTEKAEITNSGIKRVMELNGELQCSEDHLWFVYEQGVCRLKPTKDLNTGDVLYRIHDTNLRSMQDTIRSSCETETSDRQRGDQTGNLEKNNLLNRMQEQTIRADSARKGKGGNRLGKTKEDVRPEQALYADDMCGVWSESDSHNGTPAKNGGSDTKLSHATERRIRIRKEKNASGQTEPLLCAWRTYWRKILSGSSEEVRHEQMPLLQEERVASSSSQESEPSRPQPGELSSSVQFVPYEITRVVKVQKQVRMYDLKVPDYNNFILQNNVLTHNCGCGRKGEFRMLSKETVDAQYLVIEESPEDLPSHDQPRKLRIMLKGDLVSEMNDQRTIPGQKVRIAGTLTEQLMPAKRGIKTQLEIYVEAVHVKYLEQDIGADEPTGDEYETILRISQDKPLDALSKSIAPTIFGHEAVKKAIVLQLFGGVRKDGIRDKRGDMHVLLVGDPGCLAAGELVSMPNGGFQRIETFGTRHLEKLKGKVMIDRGSHRPHNGDVKTFFKYPLKKTKILTLETNKKIACSYNHPFLKRDSKGVYQKLNPFEWTQARDLKIGDKLKVLAHIKQDRRDYVVLPNSQQVDESFAEYNGYLQGDGCVSKTNGQVYRRQTIYINEEEADLTNYFKDILVRKGYTPRLYHPRPKREGNIGGRKIIRTQTLTLLMVNNRDLAEHLKKRVDRGVPNHILQSKKSVHAAFLRGLFEADGCCFIAKNKDRTAKGSIQLKASYPRLLQDVQTMLIRFGIKARVNGNNLTIKRMRDVRTYIKEIGFLSKKKVKKQKEIFKLVSHQSSPRMNHSFERIINIEEGPVQDVYDIEVEKHHRFIANGIVSHNSAKSEFLKQAKRVAPKVRMAIGKGASGAGLCVSPKSIVLSNPGGMQTIKSVVENRIGSPTECSPGVWKKDNVNDVSIQSTGRNLKLQSKNPSAIWRLTAPSKMIEVTLSSGKQIELTGNTRLFSIENGKPLWRKSKDVRVGDFIATPRRLIGGDVTEQYTVDFIQSNPILLGIKPFVKKLVKKLASKYGTIRKAATQLDIREDRLYYYWVNEKAQGNIHLDDLKKLCSEVGVDYRNDVERVSLYRGKNHRIPKFISADFMYIAGVIAGDGDIQQNDTRISIRLSNSNAELHNQFQTLLKKEYGLGYDIQAGNECRPQATRTNSKILGEILMELGIPISPKSNRIKLSESLLHLSNKLLAEFIAGLYDSDGSVSHNPTSRKCMVEFYTCSETLARQLQLLLLRYEIHTRLRKRPPSVGRVMGKYDRWVLSISGITDTTRFFNNISLRHPAKLKALNSFILTNKRPNTNNDVIPGAGNAVKHILTEQKLPLKKIGWHSNLSRAALQKIMEKVKGEEEFRNLAHSDIFWERVTIIREKPSEFDYVYDLTIKDSHNFVVDGVLVHNTATVERDELLGGWSLRAGLLPMVNGGLAIIDEFDKVDESDVEHLHSAMSDQIIVIDKASVHACYSADTEVLTDRGWLFYHEIKKEDKIAQFDAKTKRLSYAPNTGAFIYDYKGKLYHFKSQRIDILVTPNHRMYARPGIRKDYRIMQAQELRQHEYHILNVVKGYDSTPPYHKHITIPGRTYKQRRSAEIYLKYMKDVSIPLELWLEFLGYFLTDGSASSKSGAIQFTIGTEEKKKMMMPCLSKLCRCLGTHIREYSGKHLRVHVYEPRLARFLDAYHYVNKEKHISQRYIHLPRIQLKILVAAMMEGDGTRDGKSFSSTSGSLANFMQTASFLLGKSANLTTTVRQSGYSPGPIKLHRITFCDRKEQLIRREKNTNEFLYNGKVFCYSTPSGLMVTRRNGCIAIQGNTLRTECGILAAANPKYGRFDVQSELSSQITFPTTLLSRFDLIFPFQDLPDREKDTKIIERILNVHQGVVETEIPATLFKKYVAYARKHSSPVMSESASKTISQYYVALRNPNLPGRTDFNDGKLIQNASRPASVPIGARQAEALIHMSEAHAKIRLSGTVDVCDVRVAIELLSDSLKRLGVDPETGEFDIDRYEGRMTTSSRGRRDILMRILIQLERTIGRNKITVEAIQEEATPMGMDEIVLEDLLEKMKRTGDIFEPKSGFIQRLG